MEPWGTLALIWHLVLIFTFTAIQKQRPEVFLKTSQKSRENTSARVCFLIKFVEHLFL